MERKRILTRGDMDGLACSVLLTEVESIGEIRFVHPKDVQDGKIEVDEKDIIVNLPYLEGCGMWFDHHVSEERRLADIGEFNGRFAVAPSAARVIWDHYARPEFERFRELVEATDKIDSANLTPNEVTDPKGWILLAYTLDPRTGLGPEFQRYFRWLVEYVKEVPILRVLNHPEVLKRATRVTEELDAHRDRIREHTRVEDGVIITDFRNVPPGAVGNRYVVYTLYPEGNVEVRIFMGKGGKSVVAAVGHSIFNRTCRVNIGELMAHYGGGGHFGAGTCQIKTSEFDEKFDEILTALKENDPS